MVLILEHEFSSQLLLTRSSLAVASSENYNKQVRILLGKIKASDDEASDLR